MRAIRGQWGCFSTLPLSLSSHRMKKKLFYNSIFKLSFFAALVLLCDCEKWPDIVESKTDIESLPLNVTSIRARGLSDDDIPFLKGHGVRVMGSGSWGQVFTLDI